MLVDAAKHGDVEIPVFCYEPKLGQPVGACRMCLVEIEGIPKLQTGCSTPVKDGMVVHTQTDRVQEAQEAVVEFLLINHPLDCPVCDKGGECPLQDISFGWGGGRSRFIEPKRHFEKPLELSPLIAIDRERCILCYRCVRFSQEVAEDYQLVLAGARRRHVRRDVRRPPVRRAVQRQHHRAVPGGRADVAALPLPRAPVGHRGLGLGLHAVPVAVQRRASPSATTACCACSRATTTRSTTAGCATRAASPTSRSTSTSASPSRWSATAASCAPVGWERALDEAAAALGRAKGTRRRARRRRDDQRGGLPPPAPHARGARLAAPRLARARAARRRPAAPRSATPSLQATVPDLEFAHAVLVLDCEPVDDMPIVDLRIRKGVRRNRVKLAVATEPPVVAGPQRRRRRALRAGRRRGVRRGAGAALGGGGVSTSWRRPPARRRRGRRRRRPAARRRRGRRHRLRRAPDAGARGAHAARALLNVAGRLGLRDHAGAGLLEVPARTNGRGLREVGFLPDAGPGPRARSAERASTPRASPRRPPRAS